jgi:hypothetical protein
VKDEHALNNRFSENVSSVAAKTSHHRREQSVNGTTGEAVAKKARE